MSYNLLHMCSQVEKLQERVGDWYKHYRTSANQRFRSKFNQLFNIISSEVIDMLFVCTPSCTTLWNVLDGEYRKY